MLLRRLDAQPAILLILERGEDLPRVLVDTCLQQDITTAIVEGSGRASSLTLEGGPAGRRRVAGPLEVLQLRGHLEQRGTRLEPELRVVASREMDTGLEIVGGVMLEGKFETATIRISRHMAMSKKAAPETSSSWSVVAAASEDIGEPADDEDPPRVGDTVEHPKFGPCIVKGIDDEHLKVRLEGGRTIALGLSHLEFKLRGELSTGKRLYSLIIRRGR